MYQKTTLPNGMRIISCTMPHTGSVTLVFLIGAGSRYETAEYGGAFHFVEHIAFKGSTRYPTPKQVSSTIEGVGGLLNGSTDRELTTFWCKVARPHFGLALDLLADMLRSPLWETAEVEKERKVILEELAMSNDHPDYRADLLIDEVLWPDQPMGRDVGGTPDSVQGLTREMLLGCSGRQYTPSNTVLSVAGDITHEEVVGRVAGYLQDWSGGTPSPWFPAVDGQTHPQVRVETRKTDQAHLCLAVRGLPVTHPERYAMDMLSIILGEGMSSRLFLELRERQGLVYDVHSSANHFLDCGAIIIYAGVDPKRAGQAVKSILLELHKLKDGVPQEELSKAKELAKGRLLLRMEDTRSVAFWGGAQEALLNRVLTTDEVVARLDAVTREEVQRVANHLLVPERLNLAVVGPYRSDRRFASLLTL
ncbi:MAG: insulinase family protein [Chloroflexi bacterium]|nr:insulinase family protein [Chloroflexota bacterium]